MKYLLGNVFISKGNNNNNNNMVLIVLMMMMVYINININGVNAINVGGKEIIKVPALLVFGDSIVDPGNNNYLHTIGRANFPPYGRDFPHALPTGRYSNGKVPSDFFAEEVGIKELVPPYLDPKLEISELLTGVSFASGAAGYNPKSAKLANVLSLDDQLDLFKEYIQKLKDSVGENRTSTIVSESIYLVCAGSNDITNIYFTLPLTRLEYDINTYTSLMLDWGSSFLEKLYGLGARRIGVISAPPCGCLPSQRLLHTGLSRSCAQNENQAAILFNDKLSTQLNYLNQHLPQSRFVYLDIYNIILQLVTNPSQYGFEVADRGCCGTGNLEVSFLCNKLDPGTCKDASKYVFWDSFHPTQAAYKLIVHQVLQKSLPHFF